MASETKNAFKNNSKSTKKEIVKRQMKSARITKKRKKEGKSEMPAVTFTPVINYPVSAKEASSNWKKLMKSICPEAGKRVKKRGTESKPSKRKDVWFEVDESLLEEPPSTSTELTSDEKKAHLVKEKSFSGLTKAIAMDCEMVGVGEDSTESILARVSIVNHFGHCLYDKYVKPTERVTDYRTAVSGIKPSDIANGEDFKKVQKEVCDLLKGRLLIGHAIKNDLKVLFLDHPRANIRDTARYFRGKFGGRSPALRKLSEQLLGIKVQSGEHDSVEDARVAMRLYTMHRKQWEALIKKRLYKKTTVSTKKSKRPE